MAEQRIKTKVIATIGPQNQEICVNDTTTNVAFRERLPEFIGRGVDIIRLNMAFYQTPEQMRLISDEILPSVPDMPRKTIAIMGDLGPKIRINGPSEQKELRRDDEVTLHFNEIVPDDGTNRFSAVLYGEPFPALWTYIDNVLKEKEEGGKIVIAIGEDDVVMSAEREGLDTAANTLVCKVIRRGSFKGMKGLTFRDVSIKFPKYLTEQVQKTINFLLDHCDHRLAYIALSFVQTAADVLDVKDYILSEFIRRAEQKLPRIIYSNTVKGGDLKVQEVASICMPMVIAKIETEDAVKNIREIILASDGIMIARGDLGLQIGSHKLPVVQKKIIKMCNLLGKPVITATQMLKSMTEHPVPLRAEATDVFNAILDGSDALMLSDETCDGPYPYQAIEKAVQIAEQAEEYFDEEEYLDEEEGDQDRYEAVRMERAQTRYEAIRDESTRFSEKMVDLIEEIRARLSDDERNRYDRYWSSELRMLKVQGVTDRVTESACTLSNCPGVSAIIAPTTSGRTARMISRYRPEGVILIGAAHDRYNKHKLVISYGVHPIKIGRGQRYSSAVGDDAKHEACERGLVSSNARVVITAGSPLFVPGTTNMIMLQNVSQPGEAGQR